MLSPESKNCQVKETDEGAKISTCSSSKVSFKNQKNKIDNDKATSAGTNISKNNNAIKDFTPLTLLEIRTQITNLASRVPKIPASGIDPNDTSFIKDWATQMQSIIEEFNLLLCCVSAATYKWGSDRSGAADQNLTVLSNELGNAQEQISSSVSPRLTNVLAPVVEILIQKVVTKKNKMGEEIRENEFVREDVDPAFLSLCRGILCRNAVMLRQVVLTNFHKIGVCIDDYLNATKKDSESERGNFAY